MQLTIRKVLNGISRLSIILLITATIIQMPISFSVTAQPKPDIIKVGYTDYPGFFSTDSEGHVIGYYYEYLMKISNYTGWKYEFKRGTLSECYNMLKNGEIDILVPAHKNEHDSKLFDYSAKDFSKCFAALYVLNESDITFEDYSSFNGLNVGLLKDSKINDLFLSYQKSNNFSATPCFYDTEAEQTQALKNKEVDAIFSLNLRKADNEKIVARIDPVSLHFATLKKNKAIMEHINYALSKIDYYEPFYEMDIFQKYFSHIDSNFISFNSNETKFIKEHKKIKAVYDMNWYPFEYYDKKTNRFSGTTAKILELISIYSNIEFEFIKSGSLSESLDMIKNGDADIICGIVNNVPNNSNIKLTNSYYNAPFVYLGKKNAVFDANTVIALPKKYETIKETEKQIYPFVTFDSSFYTINDALKAAETNEKMLVLENTYLANKLIMSTEYYGLGILSMTSNSYSTHIGVSDNVDPILISILNKSISRISDSEKNKIMLGVGAQVNDNLTLDEFFKVYKDKIMVSVLYIFLIVILFFLDNRRRSYFKLKRIAYTDNLTGGNNLAKFKHDAYKIFFKHGMLGYAIANIDIDKFKYINEMIGYQQGDKILKSIYDTIEANLDSNELCARISADWFVLLLKANNIDSLKRKIQRIFDEISLIKCTGSKHYEIISKCGIYLIEPGEKDLNIMLDKAIMTRETIRGGHKSKYAFYTDKLKEYIKKEKDAENSMIKALANEEFIVYMQPKFDLKNRNIVGAEALVRWNHPCKGILPPVEFIPFFEKNGFIVTLDYFIFETVCKQIRWWLDNGYNPLPISVNISRVNLYHPEFVEKYKDTVKKYNIPAELLELELTESAIFENQKFILTMTKEFREAGISMSIDDFGSGYSCLSLLGSIPFETIKIDSSFLTDNYYTQSGKTVVKKIVELAKLLKIKVVSEGVETNEQEEFLRSIECDMAQGYFFAHPMPIENFSKLIYNGNNEPMINSTPLNNFIC